SNWSRSEPISVLRARADYGGRLLPAKLSVVLRDLTHQMFDHLLPDEPILLACQFCDCFRDRLASNRANLIPLNAAPPAAILVSESGATGETVFGNGALTGKPLRHASRWKLSHPSSSAR